MKAFHSLKVALVISAIALPSVRANAQFGYYSSPFGNLPVGYSPYTVTPPNSGIYLLNSGYTPNYYMAPDGTVWGPNGQPINASAEAEAAAAQANAKPTDTTLYGTRLIPRTTDDIVVTMLKDGKLQIVWQGEPQAVDNIKFSLLDKNRSEIKQATINNLPAQAVLTLTNKTAYYRVVVEYVNGTKTSITSPI